MNLYLAVTIGGLEEDIDFDKVAEHVKIVLQEAFKYSEVHVDVEHAE